MNKKLIVIIILSIYITYLKFFSIIGYAESKQFIDLPTSHWAYESIYELASRSIFSGYTDGTFKPENTITAEQFIKLVISALGYPNEKAEAGEIWSQGYIDKAVELGIIDEMDNFYGYSFNSLITRERMADILIRAEKLSDNDFEVLKKETEEAIKEYITDIGAITPELETAVYECYNLGIISGYTDKSFKPQGYLTRAESSSVIIRLINEDARTPFEPPVELSIEDIKKDPELSQRVNFEDITFNEDGTLTVTSGDGTATLNKERSNIVREIIKKATPILPDGEKLAIRYIDAGGDYQRINVELRRSSYAVHFILGFMVNPNYQHYIETIPQNPQVILSVKRFSFNDIPSEYEYPVKGIYESGLVDFSLDSRYVELYKVFINVLFNNDADKMFNYTLEIYLNIKEKKYFSENGWESKSDYLSGYRIDRLYTSSYGNEFYFSK